MSVGDGALRSPRFWPLLTDPFTPSWGEPYLRIAHRMFGAVHRARELAAGREAVCVSHQLPIWTLRRFVTGRRLWHDPRSPAVRAGLAHLAGVRRHRADRACTTPNRPGPATRCRPAHDPRLAGAAGRAGSRWSAAAPARTPWRPGRSSSSSPPAAGPRSSTTRRPAAARSARWPATACSNRARRSGWATTPGQVVVLNVWGSWCGPCRIEAPDLEFVQQQTAPLGATVLGIDVRDDRAAAADFVRDRGLTYPSIFDPPGRSLAAARRRPAQRGAADRRARPRSTGWPRSTCAASASPSSSRSSNASPPNPHRPDPSAPAPIALRSQTAVLGFRNQHFGAKRLWGGGLPRGWGRRVLRVVEPDARKWPWAAYARR